jgi:endoglucanase
VVLTQTAPTLVPNADSPDRYEQVRRLGRGVNFGNALEAPIEGEWGMIIQENYFPLIRQAGFDTVRIPIRWSAHAKDEAPYTIEPEFFQRVDWVIDKALEYDLNAVINVHHYDELFAAPSTHWTRFIEIWKAIAERYKDKPTQLYFELLNEPHGNLTKARWEKLLSETILAIRQIDNSHTIIVGGADWGGIKGLFNLALPEGERNLICTFHFYDPMLFTHQGAEWVSEEYSTLGVVWPGPPDVEVTPVPEAFKVNWVYTWFSQYNAFPLETNPAGPKPIQTSFEWAERLRERLDCPMWLGEFGAYSKADMQSRINWTSFVREQAESLEIPWAYWEFGAGFGIYDRENERWNTDLLNALIPE